MTAEERIDLKEDAMRYLLQLLPPEQYREDSRCEIIEIALKELSKVNYMLERLVNEIVEIDPIELHSNSTLRAILDEYQNDRVEMRTRKPGSAIDWIIIGGESGNESGKYIYRKCDIDWIHSIIGQCSMYNVPVFVKQLGTYISKKMGLKDRHGRNIDEWPENLKIRQFPK